MISGRAIELLKTFSEDEFKQFGLFLNSPFFNREKILFKFYTAVKKFHPFFDGRGFKKERIFSKLYPGKKYNDIRMRNVLSGILRRAQEFLAIISIQKDSFNLNTALMTELAERKQKKLFRKNETLAVNYIDNLPVKDESYYNRMFILGNLKEKFNKSQGSTFSIKNN